MPRDGSGIYSQPFPDVVEGTTIESAVYNGFTHDVEIDLNTPRPILAGGTGAASADEALDDLKAEKFKQVVTNWDTTVWRAGSFYAATTAIGIAPVAGHAFAGIVYYANATDLVIEATDLTDPINPTKYIRIMTSGVWGNWMLASGGSGTTGDYTFDNITTFPPASGQIRFNNAAENSTTEIFISHINALGVDNTGTLSASLKSGYDLFIQDKDEPAKYKIFTATAAPVVSGGDFRITVGLKTAGVDIVSGQRVSATISTGSAVVYDVAQGLTSAQMSQARANISVTKKNYIINGAMQVSQENGATAGTTDNYYPVDGWHTFLSLSGGAVSVAQVAKVTPAGSPNRIRCTVTTAQATIGGSYLMLAQKIEGLRTADLLFGVASAKTVTVQLGVNAPAGTYGVYLWNGTRTNIVSGTITIGVGEAGVDVVKSATITGVTSGTFPIDNTAGMRLEIVLALAGQANLLATNGQIFELFDVSLTEGTVAPPFQVPDYASELELCRRYWHYISDYFTTVTVATAGSKISHLFSYSTPMRAFPTALRTSFTNVANTITIDVGSVDSLKCEILLSPSNVNVLCTGTAIFTFNARL